MSWLWNALKSPHQSSQDGPIIQSTTDELKRQVSDISMVQSETDEEANWAYEDYLQNINKPKQYKVIHRSTKAIGDDDQAKLGNNNKSNKKIMDMSSLITPYKNDYKGDMQMLDE